MLICSERASHKQWEVAILFLINYSAAIKFKIVLMDNWQNLKKRLCLRLDPWPFRIRGKSMKHWTTLPLNRWTMLLLYTNYFSCLIKKKKKKNVANNLLILTLAPNESATPNAHFSTFPIKQFLTSSQSSHIIMWCKQVKWVISQTNQIFEFYRIKYIHSESSVYVAETPIKSPDSTSIWHHSGLEDSGLKIQKSCSVWSWDWPRIDEMASSIPRFLMTEILGFTEIDLKIFQYQDIKFQVWS